MPDPYISPSGAEPTSSTDLDSSRDNGSVEENYSTSGRSIQAYNKDSSVSYNTISCPCSSYVVDLSDKAGSGDGFDDNLGSGDNIGCEKNDNGIIKLINPIVINNHLINGGIPRVGDKWLCGNVKCKDGNFEWDTLHVVSVIENQSVGKNSSLLNSKKSTLNCYIPKTNILKQLYRDDGISNFSSNFAHNDPSSPDINDFIDEINGKSLYKTPEQAMYKNMAENKDSNFIEYNENGLSGYLPGKFVGTEKLITGVYINNLSISDMNKDPFSSLDKLEDDETNNGKMLFHKNGDVFKIRITGINNAMFTFSLKDRSGCDVLRDMQKNVICKGKYEISQAIPALKSGVASETYTFTMTPAADTRYCLNMSSPTITGTINLKIYQYKDATYTFAVTPSTLSGVTTTSVGDGEIIVSTEPTVYQTTTIFSGGTDSKTHTATLTHASKNLYVKNPVSRFSDVVVAGNGIKQLVIKEDRTDFSETSNIIVRPKPEHDANDNAIYSGDLKAGMIFNSTVTKTKTVRKSIDLDIHKEPCDDCPEKNILTNKFEVDNTNDIFEGMAVKGRDFVGTEFVSFLESIDCGKSITLSSHHIIDNGVDLTFDYAVDGNIIEIRDCAEGKSLDLSRKVKLPHNSEIKFENSNSSSINGSIKNDVNGTKTVVITTTIDEIKYGQEDVTFTLDINDLVTFKPNSRDQYLTFGKNSTSNNIDYWRGSVDHSAADQSVTITQQSSNGTLTAAGKRYTYTPNHNFTGKDKIMFQLYDGSESSDEKTIFITVK